MASSRRPAMSDGVSGGVTRRQLGGGVVRDFSSGLEQKCVAVDGADVSSTLDDPRHLVASLRSHVLRWFVSIHEFDPPLSPCLLSGPSITQPRGRVVPLLVHFEELAIHTHLTSERGAIGTPFE